MCIRDRAHERLEGTADDRRHQKDDEPIAFVEAVEEDGHEHRAATVDGRERAEQQPRAVLPLAWHHEQKVDDLFHEQPQHAGHDEYPEQVEEVQRDVALARGVARCV